MRHHILSFATIICITAFSLTARAGIDSKYYKKIADKVWASTDPAFDSAAVIPDSLTESNSGVIIAWSDDIDVDHEVQTTLNTISGQTNRISKKWTNRIMVKLLDQSAIDSHSEFEFGEKKQVKFMERVLLYDLKTAFGVRVHKPDGRIIEIDLNDAIEIGEGKKGKDNRTYKIAIPGLEPGDVLDYFRFTEEMAETFSLEPQNLVLCARYPIMNRKINLAVDPAITVEYKCYNGVPPLSRGTTERGSLTASLSLMNVPSVNFEKFTMKFRQLPFIRVQYLNNIDKLYISKNSRGGGLHGDVFPGRIISELRDYLYNYEIETKAGAKALKTVKDNFLKANPEASPRQIADAAWLALMYQDLTSKGADTKSSDEFERALVFSDMLRKLKIYPDDQIGIGIINPRSDVPVSDISAWDESNFVIRTPDALYYIPLHTAMSPGELPGDFYGEGAVLYFGDRKTWTTLTPIKEYALPHRKASENSAVFRDTITINDDKVAVKSMLKMSGAVKSLYSDLTEVPEWASEVEDYFDIPENRRFRDKSYDPASRSKELKTMLKENGVSHYGKNPEKVTEAVVKDRGIRPDSTDIVVESAMEFDGLVEHFGDDLGLTVGMLSGVPTRLSDNERSRILDVMLPFINQEIHSMLIKAPDGYCFDEASVEALQRNISDVTAQFNVQSKINAQGDLELNTLLRYKQADVALAFWPRLLKVLDEAAAFGNASVTLVKKQ
ncbi:MAG: DUF3857 domain-containing protein [Muribaculaceae bacterium]|nr:DUF3857 domain-containing protein [Muribaculaceae bacterium]